MSDKIIELKYPIKIDGQETSRLTMRRPTVGDYIAIEKQGGLDSEQELTLFANLCGVKPSEFSALDMVDYQQLQKKHEACFETGETKQEISDQST